VRSELQRWEEGGQEGDGRFAEIVNGLDKNKNGAAGPFLPLR
jgi:hypothetical protein